MDREPPGSEYAGHSHATVGEIKSVPRRLQQFQVNEFGLVCGPDNVDPRELSQWLIEAQGFQVDIRACLSESFRRCLVQEELNELLRYGIEPVEQIDQWCRQNLLCCDLYEMPFASLRDIQLKLKRAGLRSRIGDLADVLACRNELRAIILPQGGLSGSMPRVLVGDLIAQFLAAVSEGEVLCLPDGAAIGGGWLRTRTLRETHLSEDEFTLLIKDTVERERRKLRSLEQRHASTAAIVASPEPNAGNRSGERGTIEKRLASESPERFEQVVAKLLEAAGLAEVWVTPHSGDEGVDVRASMTIGGLLTIPIAVQAKRVAGSIHAPTIREFRGSLRPGEAGIIVTTGEFSAGAVSEATRSGHAPITLISRRQLLDLIAMLGVTW